MSLLSIVVLDNETVFVEDSAVNLLVNESTKNIQVVVSQDTNLIYAQLFLLLITALSTTYIAYKIWKYFKEKEEKEKKQVKK